MERGPERGRALGHHDHHGRRAMHVLAARSDGEIKRDEPDVERQRADLLHVVATYAEHMSASELAAWILDGRNIIGRRA